MSASPQSYKSSVKVTWCPGCGDFGVLSAMYKAFLQLGLDPKRTVVVSGIGCSGRTPIFTTCYGFHGIHGRVLPTATGLKLARPDLNVVAVGGDGDGLAIGGGHFMHAARRNVDLAYLMMDNQVYGLTKGQASPTSREGRDMSRANPYGILEDEINPVALALAYGATWVGRGFTGDPLALTGLIVEAMEHRGFAFLHIISPCVVFNNQYEYYRKKVVPIPEGHDPTDKRRAFDLWHEPGKVFLGVFYKEPQAVAYGELIAAMNAKARESAGPGDTEKLLETFI